MGVLLDPPEAAADLERRRGRRARWRSLRRPLAHRSTRSPAAAGLRPCPPTPPPPLLLRRVGVAVHCPIEPASPAATRTRGGHAPRTPMPAAGPSCPLVPRVLVEPLPASPTHLVRPVRTRSRPGARRRVQGSRTPTKPPAEAADSSTPPGGLPLLPGEAPAPTSRPGTYAAAGTRRATTKSAETTRRYETLLRTVAARSYAGASHFVPLYWGRWSG
jgi:hypothetical protein